MTILNLDYNRGRLILKALNKHKHVTKAARELGISLPTVLKYRKLYHIELTLVNRELIWTSEHRILKIETHIKKQPFKNEKTLHI